MFKMHSLGGVFSVCQDRAVLRRNPIRLVASQDPIVENRENSMVFTLLTHKHTLKNSFFCDFMCVVANFDESGIIGIHPCAITSHSLGKRFMAKSAIVTANIMGGRSRKASWLWHPGGGLVFSDCPCAFPQVEEPDPWWERSNSQCEQFRRVC